MSTEHSPRDSLPLPVPPETALTAPAHKPDFETWTDTQEHPPPGHGLQDAFGHVDRHVQSTAARHAQIKALGLDRWRPPTWTEIRAWMKAFAIKHGAWGWWLHSFYALGLGSMVVYFGASGAKGFERIRLLSLALVVVWLVVMIFFRVHGSGPSQMRLEEIAPRARIRFLAMTYVLKNMYQTMLFFLVPFYYKSTTFSYRNKWFTIALGICAILSTLDVVFDRVLMRWKVVSASFYSVTLFAVLNLLIPALLPNTRTLYTLITAAVLAVLGFWTLHIGVGVLRDWRYAAALGGALLSAILLVYFGRTFVPPVPLYMKHGGVGSMTLSDGRLAMEVRSLHPEVIRELIAVTDIMVPGGKGDRLHHSWKFAGVELARSGEETSRVPGPAGTVRLRSTLKGNRLPSYLVGQWSVDVLTEDNQLVGRVAFEVTNE